MKHWTEKHITELQKTGKIRGFIIHEKKKGYSEGKRVVRKQNNRSRALEWLEQNLMYWSNQNAVQMEKEHQFCERGWRFDFSWPSLKIAVEYEGGIFMPKSGHNTAKHYTKDTEKYNRATVMGYRVIRVTALNYTTVLQQMDELLK
jgi:very-short-patch-repair endonuclease